MANEHAKRAAAQKAAEWIREGQIVGLGTGSTASFFIEALLNRCKQENFSIRAVSSSRRSADLARRGGIKVIDINDVPGIDIAVDGADEVDTEKRMIKGGGGAHVREKILASSSRELVVIIDETKWVPRLGKAGLPVEILPYGSSATRRKIEGMHFSGSWRMVRGGVPFVSENGNLILDIAFDAPLENPEAVHEQLIRIPGVVDTGFFFGLAGRVVTGYEDGSTDVR